MDALFTLFLGTVPAVLLVVVVVEALKRMGAVTDESLVTPQRAGIVTGLVLASVALVSEFYPVAAPYIAAAVPLIFGGLIAGLFFDIAGARLLGTVERVFAALLPNNE